MKLKEKYRILEVRSFPYFTLALCWTGLTTLCIVQPMSGTDDALKRLGELAREALGLMAVLDATAMLISEQGTKIKRIRDNAQSLWETIDTAMDNVAQ